jgi:hypothetical protein
MLTGFCCKHPVVEISCSELRHAAVIEYVPGYGISRERLDKIHHILR